MRAASAEADDFRESPARRRRRQFGRVADRHQRDRLKLNVEAEQRAHGLFVEVADPRRTHAGSDDRELRRICLQKGSQSTRVGLDYNHDPRAEFLARTLAETLGVPLKLPSEEK